MADNPGDTPFGGLPDYPLGKIALMKKDVTTDKKGVDNPWGQCVDLHFVLAKDQQSTTAKILVPSNAPVQQIATVPTELVDATDARFGTVSAGQIVRLKSIYLYNQLVLMEALARDIQTGQGPRQIQLGNLTNILSSIQAARKALDPFAFGRLQPSPTFIGGGEYQKES